jgi:hypothetical protein
VIPDVGPPTADPATADSVEMYRVLSGRTAQILRERSPSGQPAQDEVIAEVYAPEGAACGAILW